MQQDEAYLNAKKVVRTRRGLYSHAMVYAIVNTVLFTIDYLTAGGPWIYWPMIGWGIGLVINAVAVFSGLVPGSEAEEHAILRYLETHSR